MHLRSPFLILSSLLVAACQEGAAVCESGSVERDGQCVPAALQVRMTHLREEADPAVRVSIVRALHGTSTSDAIALMSDRLAASTSIPERSAIITWLGEASRTRPEVRALLTAHARGEGDARLVQQIGAFVPASELR